MISPDSNSSYVTLASLRLAGFPENRIHGAMICLFHGQKIRKHSDNKEYENIEDWPKWTDEFRFGITVDLYAEKLPADQVVNDWAMCGELPSINSTDFLDEGGR